jgi:hypothetical protein
VVADVSVPWWASSSYGPVSDHVDGVSVVLCVSPYSSERLAREDGFGWLQNGVG